ncbi:uncharacterized protein LOC126692928 isoform X5 [Quercus robur]|uniref:uncharacterized protein LOC126692928 isoform X5 n=1 Tax=Quercus robur TaxID=38942 RepID=UPI0021639BC3|nr:uncharacterized protein LOC126692928 isoform X5 [Quercus robur]
MEDVKKRKVGEAVGNGETSSSSSEEEMRLLLDPLPKPQLVHLLSKLGSQYPSIAEEIRSIASADPVHRKLFVRGLAWNTTSETLCAGRLAVCNLACEGLSGASTTPDLAQRKLYIGGLSPNITSEELLKYFEKHGDIEEGSVAYDKDTNVSRGFGFVTYKTVEAAKKAIDDPNKILGGRNIIVKLADSHKGKSLQTQLPTAVVPMALPMAAGYPQPGNAHVSTTSVAYTYPQTVASYPVSSYPSPPTAPAPYQAQPQISYAPVTLKKESLGLPSTPMGIGCHLVWCVWKLFGGIR